MAKVTFLGAGSAVFARHRLMADLLAIGGLDEGTFAPVDIRPLESR